MGMITKPMLGMMQRRALAASDTEEKNPQIAKNTILRDKVNDEQVRLAKQGPMMVRNPKKIAKGA